MADVPARKTRLLIDEFDFSGDTSGVTLAMNVDVLDAPALQADALQRMPGLTGSRLTHNGYYTGPDAGDLEPELAARMGTESPVYVAVLFDTRQIGNPSYVIEGAWHDQLTINTPVRELITLAGQWSEQAARRGYCIADGVVDTVAPLTHVDFGGAGANGGYAYLFVRNVNGVPPVGAEIDLEFDDNQAFTSPTVKGTFMADNLGVVALTLTGTLDRYCRLNVTALGTATALTIACVVCVPGRTM